MLCVHTGQATHSCCCKKALSAEPRFHPQLFIESLGDFPPGGIPLGLLDRPTVHLVPIDFPLAPPAALPGLRIQPQQPRGSKNPTSPCDPVGIMGGAAAASVSGILYNQPMTSKWDPERAQPIPAPVRTANVQDIVTKFNQQRNMHKPFAFDVPLLAAKSPPSLPLRPEQVNRLDPQATLFYMKPSEVTWVQRVVHDARDGESDTASVVSGVSSSSSVVQTMRRVHLGEPHATEPRLQTRTSRSEVSIVDDPEPMTRRSAGQSAMRQEGAAAAGTSSAQYLPLRSEVPLHIPRAMQPGLHEISPTPQGQPFGSGVHSAQHQAAAAVAAAVPLLESAAALFPDLMNVLKSLQSSTVDRTLTCQLDQPLVNAHHGLLSHRGLSQPLSILEHHVRTRHSVASIGPALGSQYNQGRMGTGVPVNVQSASGYNATSTQPSFSPSSSLSSSVVSQAKQRMRPDAMAAREQPSSTNISIPFLEMSQQIVSGSAACEVSSGAGRKRTAHRRSHSNPEGMLALRSAQSQMPLHSALADLRMPFEQERRVLGADVALPATVAVAAASISVGDAVRHFSEPSAVGTEGGFPNLLNVALNNVSHVVGEAAALPSADDMLGHVRLDDDEQEILLGAGAMPEFDLRESSV
jgi:hypothetical protein